MSAICNSNKRRTVVNSRAVTWQVKGSSRGKRKNYLKQPLKANKSLEFAFTGSINPPARRPRSLLVLPRHSCIFGKQRNQLHCCSPSAVRNKRRNSWTRSGGTCPLGSGGMPVLGMETNACRRSACAVQACLAESHYDEVSLMLKKAAATVCCTTC